MIYHVNWVLLPAFPMTIGYLYYVLKIAGVLRERHYSIWCELGSFGIKNWGIANSWAVGSFVLFQGRYKSLGDDALSDLVFRARFLAYLTTAILVLNVLLVAHGYNPVLTNAPA